MVVIVRVDSGEVESQFLIEIANGVVRRMQEWRDLALGVLRDRAEVRGDCGVLPARRDVSEQCGFKVMRIGTRGR